MPIALFYKRRRICIKVINKTTHDGKHRASGGVVGSNKMDKFKLNNIIFQAALVVLQKNENWIKYGDLLYQTTEKVKEVATEITIDAVEKWIKECIDIRYISVKRSQRDEINADDYCRGEWLGLNNH